MRHTSKRQRVSKKDRPSVSLLERIQADAAGIDCGQNSHFVAVPPDRDPQPVRAFRTFTAELEPLADWLAQCRIKTVAMESTGVYWIPLYEVLEQRGLEVMLVNAREVHNVRGRKRDVMDCEWLRELHSVGLLRTSFRPAAAIVPLRSFMRQRETLVEEASAGIHRMQKALTQMNVMRHVVMTDITGQTGLRIVRSILAGERDPERLAAHRDYRCHASHAEIVAALTGNYRAEHRFALRQNFAAYEFRLKPIAECDTEIEGLLSKLAAQQPPPAAPLPEARSKRASKHQPQFDIRGPLQRLTGGTDLSQIDSIGPQAALHLIGEIGTDLTRWPTEKHFTSWLALAPNNKNLRRTPAQRPHSTLGQSRGGHLAPLRHESDPHFDCARGLRSAPGRARRQGQGHHRCGPQTCGSGLPRALRRLGLQRPRRSCLPPAQPHP